MLSDPLSSGPFQDGSPHSVACRPLTAQGVLLKTPRKILGKQHARQMARLKNALFHGSLSRDRGLTNWRDSLFLLYTAASQWTKIQLVSTRKVGCKYFISKAGCVYKLC